MLEASEPVIFQARVLKNKKVGELVFVPFGDVQFLSEGEKWKAPKSLHPMLPFTATCSAGAPELKDEAQFLIKSPLAGKLPAQPEPVPPYWAVLCVKAAAKPQEASEANMAQVMLKIEHPMPEFELRGRAVPKPKAKGRAAKKARTTMLSFKVAVFVNTKDVQRGEVLVSLPQAKTETMQEEEEETLDE